MQKVLSSGLEDYIEAIYVAEMDNRLLRGADLARELGISRASVSEALAKLVSKGLVKYESYGRVYLTDSGKKEAQNVYEKHNILESFFRDVLGVDSVEAGENACKIEHIVSENIIEKIRSFTAFIQENKEVAERFKNKK